MNERTVLADSRISDITEYNPLDTTAGLPVVLGIETDFHIEKTTFLNMLYTDVLEQDITYPVSITAIYRHASLIHRVVFIVFQNIYITENKILDNLAC